MSEDKAISAQKRQELIKNGAPPDVLDKLEEDNAATKEAADEAGLETKEAEPQPVDMEEIIKSFAIVAEQVVEQGKVIGELQATLKELTKTKEQQITEQVQEIPQASLSAILTQQFGGVLQKGNAIDKTQADKLKGPETPETQKGVPGVDTPFSELYGGVQ